MDANQRDQIGELLSAYLDGELSADQRAQAERLITEDSEARALLVVLRQTADGVRQLPRAIAPADVLTEIRDRIERAELLGPPDQPVTLSRHQKRPLRSILATAAALVITVGGGLWAIRTLSRHDSGRRLTTGSPMPVTPGGPQSVANPVMHNPMTGLRADTEIREKPVAIVGRSGQPGVPRVDSPTTADQSLQTGFASKQTPLDLLDDSATPSPRGAAELDGVTLTAEIDAPRMRTEGAARQQSPARSKAEADGQTPAPVDELVEKDSRTPPLHEAALTIEQQLAGGLTREALREYPFDNEPLRLDISVKNARILRRVAERILNQVTPKVDANADGFIADDTARTTLQPGRVAGQVPGQPLGRDQPFIVRGEPGHNFTPTRPSEVQLLVRLDRVGLARIVDIALEDNDAIVARWLSVGRMSARSDTRIRQLARMVLGDGDDRGPETDIGDADGRAESNSASAPDLATLLRKIGIAPPQPGLPVTSRPEHAPAPYDGDERSVADATDAKSSPADRADAAVGRRAGLKKIPDAPRSIGATRSHDGPATGKQGAAGQRSPRGAAPAEQTTATGEPSVQRESNRSAASQPNPPTQKRSRRPVQAQPPAVPLYTLVIRLTPAADDTNPPPAAMQTLPAAKHAPPAATPTPPGAIQSPPAAKQTPRPVSPNPSPGASASPPEHKQR